MKHTVKKYPAVRMDKWGADSTGHLHCNKLHADDLLNRNRTAGKIVTGHTLTRRAL